MPDRVTRSPVRLDSRDGKICYRQQLEHDFLLFALLPSSFSPPLSRYVSLGVVSSVQQLSAPIQQVVRVLVSFVFCLISEFLLFLFFVSFFNFFFVGFIFLIGVFVVPSYPVR